MLRTVGTIHKLTITVIDSMSCPKPIHTILFTTYCHNYQYRRHVNITVLNK